MPQIKFHVDVNDSRAVDFFLHNENQAHIPNLSRLYGTRHHSVRFDAKARNSTVGFFQYFEMFLTDWKMMDSPKSR